MLFCLNCTDDRTNDVENVSDIFLKWTDESQSFIDVPHYGGSYTIYYETNIKEDLNNRLKVSVADIDASWCKASIDKTNKSIKIIVLSNDKEKPREGTVILGNHDISLSIRIHQQEYISTNIGDQWEKIDIISAWTPDYLTEEHTIEKAFDGDVATYFNAKQGEADFPYEIKFTLNTTENVTHLIYYPRMDNGTRWGQFGEFEVWYNTAENADFVKAGSFDFKKELSNPSTAWFESPIEQPNEILLKVYSGYNNRVSIGEIEFYIKSSKSFDYTSIFSDKACTALKSNVSLKEIETIPEPFYRDLAKRIFLGTYDTEYRIQKYRPYQHPSHAALELKTGKYSLRDNTTGICYNNLDENLIVFVDDLHGNNVSLNIVDFQESANEGITYPLHEGVNILKPTKKGHIYIFYHVDDPLPLNPSAENEIKKIDERAVKIHIATGRVNGYFDIRKHTNSDWKDILNNAVSNEIDVLGLYSHVVWNVQDYRDYNTDIVLMTNLIDNLIKQQHEFMGLYHHNRSFKNRHFLRIDYFAPAAYATDYRTVYKNTGYKEVFCSEDGFKRRLWVMGHEVGHVNQTRPGMKWHGTTEVTNNLYALYNQKCFHGEARRLITGDTKQGYSSGNDGYDAAFERIVNAGRDWYVGGDNWGSNFIPRLTPFWQLYLYFVEIKKQEHFYHDIFEHYRTSSSPNDDGMIQLDFVRTVCNVSKTNMIDFFEKWGFLKPIDLMINDYGNQKIIITYAQINNLKSEIISKGYPKPDIEVYKLTDSNYKQFMTK